VHARHDTDITCSARTGKIIKIGFGVFERGENLLQNGSSKVDVDEKPIFGI